MATVCITGSTDGIGLAATRQLLADGHALVVHARSPERGQKVLADPIGQRLVFLGSGMVARGAVDPAHLGTARSQGQAYADSKAIDVALGLGWGRRLPHLRTGAVDPGWVRTKLAGADAPGHVSSGGGRVAYAAVHPAWTGGYTLGARPARTPAALTDPHLQDALMDALDRLAGLT